MSFAVSMDIGNESEPTEVWGVAYGVFMCVVF